MQQQGGRASATRALIDRAAALAAERGTRATTLHLAAALLEDGGELGRALAARGLRAEELSHAGAAHGEDPGTMERIQTAAKRIAAARAAETGAVHLLAAALGDPSSALAAVLAQRGGDPGQLADEALRAGTRGAPAVRGTILHSGGAVEPRAPRAPATAAGNGSRRPILSTRTESAVAPVRVMAPSSPARAIPAVNAPGASDTPRAAHGAPAPAGTPSNARTGRVLPPRARPERSPHELDPRTFPALAMFARNLSAEGDRGALDPVVGRAREIERALDAIARREGRGALLVGPAGVGKSTVVRALARSAGERVVLALRHAEIAAQARGPGAAERARSLVEELLRVGDRAIVALDPLAPWFLTRDAPEELVLELRAALAAGKLSWVGTATAEEARRLAEAEPWLERAALRVELDEPSGDTLRAVVQAFAPAISAFHGVVAEVPVLQCAAELSERYLGGRAQPDRALHVVDLALARARRVNAPALSRDTVAEVVAELGGVPLDRVAASDSERLLALEGALGSRVVGHGHALARVAQTLRRNAVGFRGARPIGTFLFLGPTGVGKTETAKAIAEVLFPGGCAMTRLDMAEFSEAHTVARLIGAPPGYVGHHDGGQLTEAVRRRPYQLVLLDEIEKAHRDVLEALLALLDEGRMTDGRGRTVDFRNTVIVMTSNLGAAMLDGREPAAPPPARRIGFSAAMADPPHASRDEDAAFERVLDAARASLPPELWNRIDHPVVFGPLTRTEVSTIASRLLEQSFARLFAEQGVGAEATPSLIEFLLDNGGYEPALGARPMRRAIARLVEAPIADAVLRGDLRRGEHARILVRDWGLEVRSSRAD